MVDLMEQTIYMNFCFNVEKPPCEIEEIREKHLFLGMFAKLRKATISFVMSICPPVCLSSWYSLTPTGWIVIKLDI
jgi:hypothetical protein